MTIYPYLFVVLLMFLCYMVYQKYINAYTSIVSKPLKRYDYIIVGAGTTGCVLASRLSEDPNTNVLLVEAGEYMGFFTKIPLTATAAQQGPNDWAVKTEPQKYSSFGLWKQSQFIPRGKGLGGSGQINFLLHGLGLLKDYEKWMELGFEGWTEEELRPYFIKAFGTVRSEFDSNYCAADGECPGSKAPMQLKIIDEEDDLMNTFKEASSILKTDYTVFRRPVATVRDGERYSSFDAYLKPVMRRKNLHVLLRTQAVSIRFQNTTATSLYILQNHRLLDNIFVNKEIILCAGTIKTPQLLMLSGIGPRGVIERLRIKPTLFNEHVGKNLHDHMNMPIYVSIQKPFSITLSKVFTINTVWEYYWKSSGILSFPPLAGVEYSNNTAAMLFAMGTASERLLRDLSNYKPKVFRDAFPFYNITGKEGFMFLSTCLHPKSRGTVTITKATSSTPTAVDPRYLEQYYDVQCMIEGIRRVEQLVTSKPFEDIGARIHWPRAERCLSFWRYTKEQQKGPTHKRRRFKDQPKAKLPLSFPRQFTPPDSYLECIIRELAVTGHHVGGTCSGGRVVDNRLRVRSVSGVRIVDSSVLPSPVSLYPNSVLISVAERAADIIKIDNNYE